MKVYNILMVKKALAMSVHYIIEYTICNLAINAQFHQFKRLCILWGYEDFNINQGLKALVLIITKKKPL